jgi:sulfate/thiosulfate transport system ATP-binding protein
VNVRPHEIDVLHEEATDALPARLLHTATIGLVARLEFALERDTRTINVELQREVYRALQLTPGALAYLRPTRVRHFGDSQAAN